MAKGAGVRPPSTLGERLRPQGAPDWGAPIAHPPALGGMDWAAVKSGDVLGVERSVRERGADPNGFELHSDGDRPALHTAAIHGHAQLVASLLQMRADPWLKAPAMRASLVPPPVPGPRWDVQHADTALELALRRGHVEVAELLRLSMRLPSGRRPGSEPPPPATAAPAPPRGAPRVRAGADVRLEPRGATAGAALGPTAAARPAAADEEAVAAAAQRAERGAAGVPTRAPRRVDLLNPNALPSWGAKRAPGGSASGLPPSESGELLEPAPGGPHAARPQPPAWRGSLLHARAAEVAMAAELRARAAAEDELANAPTPLTHLPTAARGAPGGVARLGGGGETREAFLEQRAPDVLTARARPPVGGVRERHLTRWR